MDPDWSAFAHYNRAYCTIQIKGDGYIRRAIDDLRAALRELETYKQNSLNSEMYVNVEYSGSGQYYYMLMECQLFHHIDTQIIETIEKLETIDTMKREVTTVRRDILDLIPGADCKTEQILQEYRQSGLLFTYNIDVEPQFCYGHMIAFSLAMLESVAAIILFGFYNEILAKSRSNKLKDMIDSVCSLKAFGEGGFEVDELRWMSRCVSRAINTGINSNNLIRDVFSLFPITQTDLESSFKMTTEASQLKQFSNSQATYILELLDSSKQEMNNLISSQEDEILFNMTNVAMEVLKETIGQTIRENIKPGIREKIFPGELHEQLCCLYRNVTSPSRSGIEQFADCIRDLATFSANPSQLSDDDFKNF